MGPDGIDPTDEMRAAMVLHSQGGRRIFSPLYYALIADIVAAQRDSGAARVSLRQVEQVVKATGKGSETRNCRRANLRFAPTAGGTV